MMSTTLLPRVDAASKLQPNTNPLAFDDAFARADGLTVDEAQELAAWLAGAGYTSIEVVHEADHVGVVWHR